MTHRNHLWLALADALAWPIVAAAVIGFSSDGGPFGPVPLVLMATCPVWAAMRVRRALGYGRQPYRLTTAWLMRVAFYLLLFLVAFRGLASLTAG